MITTRSRGKVREEEKDKVKREKLGSMTKKMEEDETESCRIFKVLVRNRERRLQHGRGGNEGGI